MGDAHLEQELKFELSEAMYRQIITDEQAQILKIEEQENIYFESEDRALEQAWGMLRIRRSLPDQMVLTLKFGLSLEEGYMQAIELESQWLGESFPKYVGEGDLPETFRRALEDRGALRPYYRRQARLCNHRTKILLAGWPEVFELDAMTFDSGLQTYELELETRFATEAQDWVLERWGTLQPAVDSKYARVLRDLRGLLRNRTLSPKGKP